jgi:hypothetical protein
MAAWEPTSQGSGANGALNHTISRIFDIIDVILIATNNVHEKITHGVFIKGISIIQYMGVFSKGISIMQYIQQKQLFWLIVISCLLVVQDKSLGYFCSAPHY